MRAACGGHSVADDSVLVERAAVPLWQRGDGSVRWRSVALADAVHEPALCAAWQTSSALQALRQALPSSAAPAIFSGVVSPALERAAQRLPLRVGVDDAVLALDAAAMAHVTALAGSLLSQLCDELRVDAPADARGCVRALTELLRRVALSGAYAPNGPLDDVLDDAAQLVLGAKHDASAAAARADGQFVVRALACTWLTQWWRSQRPIFSLCC